MVAPLGIRNNNPGNIRPVKAYKWQGEIGENGGFVVFDSMTNGIRALCKNLIAYQERHGLRTVRQAVERWSTTDREAYVQLVCAVLDCDDDQDFFDFHDPEWLWWMAYSISIMECGEKAATQYITDADITAGVNAALV